MILGALTVAVVSALAQPVEVCDSAVIGQARAGLERLRAAAEVHGQGGVTTVTYEGTAAVEAHLARPHQLREHPVRLTVAFDGGRLAVRETAGRGEETTETTLVVGGRVATQVSDQRPFEEAKDADAAALLARRWLPRTALSAALAAGPSVRAGPVVSWKNGELTPCTFAAGGGACTLLLDDRQRVVRIESLAADQRLGDVCEWTEFRYGEGEQAGGAGMPVHIERFMTAGSVTVSYALDLAKVEPGGAGAEVFALPAGHAGDIPAWTATPGPDGQECVVRAVAEGLFVVDVPDANGRVMVIERAGDLVVLEAPDGDATCGGLLRTLAGRFPGKKVGVVAFGHHHPSYTGGLRAFAREGAAVVTPGALAGYVRLILGRACTLGGPAVAAPAGTPLVTFEGEHTIEAGDNTVRLIDIGSLSAHTEHYTLFYFPARGVLFEGDLGFFPEGRAARSSARLEGLVAGVEREGLRPARLILAWPLKGTRAEVPWDEVVSLVEKERARKKEAAGSP